MEKVLEKTITTKIVYFTGGKNGLRTTKRDAEKKEYGGLDINANARSMQRMC